MINDNDLISVRNRNNGTTSYTIPDRNIRRSWAPQEVKKVPFEELKAFSYLPGGMYALNNLLIVENKEVIDLLNMQVEPEYYYTEENIRDMLLNKSMDEFLDFLDFAPEGAIEIAKDIAVKEEIPDVRKRDALSKKTGLNINNAIMVNHVMDEEKAEEEAPKQRRVQIEEEKPEAPVRRAAAPQEKYKVVNKG